MNLKLKEKFNFYFNSNIWKILFDGVNGSYLVECRNLETKSLELFSVTNEMVLIPIELPNLDNWWISCDYVVDNKLIVSEYSNPELPVVKFLSCYDLITKKELWALPDHEFVGIDGIFTILKNTIQNSLKAVNLNNGQVIDYSSKQFDLMSNSNYVCSINYDEGTDGFATINQFLLNNFGLKSVKRIEYLEFNQYIILSLYLNEDNSLDLCNYLWILNLEGEQLEVKTIQKGLKKVNKDSFMVVNSELVFINEKRNLIVYNLD